ncbi:MAG: hypothetical protein J6W63_10760 [Treponema sp.]|nr:hypothetical protein [Treponema sp.]
MNVYASLLLSFYASTAGIVGAAQPLPWAMEPNGGTPESPLQKKLPQKNSANIRFVA